MPTLAVMLQQLQQPRGKRIGDEAKQRFARYGSNEIGWYCMA
jgi:hypothetical protein